MLPMDSTEPELPIDRIDPREPIDRIDPVERNERIERAAMGIQSREDSGVILSVVCPPGNRAAPATTAG